MTDLLVFTYNGIELTTGDQEGPFVITKISGLDPAPIKMEIVPKAGESGAWTYGALITERHILIEGLCIEETAEDVWESMLSTWSDAFAPQTDDLPFAFNLPVLGEKHIMCKPADRDFEVDSDFSGAGQAIWMVELVAGDPTMYDGAGGS